MTDKQLVKQIMKKNPMELLSFILENVEYLTDSYYREFGSAVYDRFNQLEKEKG